MARYHERESESDSEMEVEDEGMPDLFVPGDEDVPPPVVADDDVDSEAGELPIPIPMDIFDEDEDDEHMFAEVAGIVTGDDGDFDDGRSVGGDD
jgi:hypothetical protein